MKSKLIAVLLIMIVAATLVGCRDNDKEPTRDTVYVTVTSEEFVESMKQCTGISAYDDVSGYVFDLSYKSDVSELIANGAIDIGNFDDVAFSINVVRKYDQTASGGSGGQGGGNGAVTVATYNSRTVYNAYLYNHTLYFDVKENNNQIQKDSIKNLDNNLADMLDLITGDSVFDFDSYFDTGVDIFGDFADYTQILYCESLGHYIVDVDYSAGEADEESPDPFTIGMDVFVDGSRITEVRVNYISHDIKIDAHIKEDAGNIEHPDDLDSYVGSLLDELEKIIFTEVSDFYGEWIGYFGGSEDYLVLEFTEQSATLTVVTDEGEEVIEFESSGFRLGIVTLVSEDGIYSLKFDGDVILLTMADGTEVYIAQRVE